MTIILQLLLMLFSFTTMVQASFTIPEGILLSNGLSTVFVAKFAAFLAVLIFWTVLIGQLLKSLCNCPTIAGQIIGGIFIGPSCFDILHWKMFYEPLRILDMATGTLYSLASSDLFLFFVILISSALTISYLLWIAGHETDIRDIFHVGLTATVAGILGAVMPIFFTVICMYSLLGTFNLVQAIGFGLIFSATSVSIPVTMLVSRKKMHLKSSKATLGAAIIDDIFSIMLLSMFFIILQASLAADSSGAVAAIHTVSIGESIIYMMLSFTVIFFTGYFIIPPMLHWLETNHLSYLLSSFASCAMLLYFAFAELIGGLAGITGAFFAGLFHRKGDLHHQAQKTISPFVHSFLLPLFLGSIGLQVDISSLSYQEWIYVAILLICAILSKLFACYCSTALSNFSNRKGSDSWSLLETYLFGSSMIARGEVGLVISTILRSFQIISTDQYVMAVVVIILSTIISPLMLAVGFHASDKLSRQDKTDDYSCNIGLFNAIGTDQMLHIILGYIDSVGTYKTSVMMSEDRRIITLEGENIKIIFNPEEGIVFKGNRRKIENILINVKKLVQQEVDRLLETQEIDR